jgi:hypothetical protein
VLFGEGDEGGGGGGGGDEGLLDHDVLSGFEGGLGEGEVAVGGVVMATTWMEGSANIASGVE